MKNKKTLVIGVSRKPNRPSSRAIESLLLNDIETILLAKREGEILGLPILVGKPELEGIHTVSLFLSPENQKEYYDYILNVIRPERIIFNFKTENPEFAELAIQSDIEVIEDCMKLMLRFDNF